MATETKPIGRAWIARAFTVVEDIVYIGLGLLLSVSAIALMTSGAFNVFQSLASGTLAQNIIALLDRILLVLLAVELLYTVQVSIREHSIVPEPFLLVGVIAAIRRVLVVTAEFGHVSQLPPATLQRFLYELVVLTILILVLVIALILIRRHGAGVAAER